MFNLSDDGTMDTVLECSECGVEVRYNYDGECDDDGGEETRTDQERYDAFVKWAMEDAAEQHECATEQAESGYTDCACRDCFDTTVSSDVKRPELCSDCVTAGCNADGAHECSRIPDEDSASR